MKKVSLKFLALVAAVSCLTGCLEINGALSVMEPIFLKNDDGYEAPYDVKNHAGKVWVTAEEHDFVIDLGSHFIWGSKKYVFTNSKLANGKSKYSLNGISGGDKIYLTAQESGQAYDLEAMYSETQKFLSGVLTKTEDCTKLINGQFVPGKQTVKYRKISRTKSIIAHLISPNNKKVVAEFKGSDIRLEEDYVPTLGNFHAGECK